jgi:ATP-dependent RNA helicase DDX3X
VQVKVVTFDDLNAMFRAGEKEAIRRVVRNLPSKESVQTLAMSSKFDRDVRLFATEIVREYVFISVDRIGAVSEKVNQRVVDVRCHDKDDALFQVLAAAGSVRTIVFVGSKESSRKAEAALLCRGVPVAKVYGIQDPAERATAVEKFRSCEVPVLIATRGIGVEVGKDVSSVRHVINYDLPTDTDDYVTRAACAGRGKTQGLATSLFCESDVHFARKLVSVLEKSIQSVPEFLVSLCADGRRRNVAPERMNDVISGKLRGVRL